MKWRISSTETINLSARLLRSVISNLMVINGVIWQALRPVKAISRVLNYLGSRDSISMKKPNENDMKTQ